jgi:hypothetical protein
MAHIVKSSGKAPESTHDLFVQAMNAEVQNRPKSVVSNQEGFELLLEKHMKI